MSGSKRKSQAASAAPASPAAADASGGGDGSADADASSEPAVKRQRTAATAAGDTPASPVAGSGSGTKRGQTPTRKSARAAAAAVTAASAAAATATTASAPMAPPSASVAAAATASVDRTVPSAALGVQFAQQMLLSESDPPLPPVRVEPTFGGVRARVFAQLSPVFVPDRIVGVDDQRRELTELLARVVTNAQNSAVLCFGLRGCGKSMTVKHVLRSLKARCLRAGAAFIAIELNGLVQTDDTQAMREIVRQLCVALEISVPGDAALDAAVDVSAEAAESQAAAVRAAGGHATAQRAATFADHLRFLHEVLRNGKHANRPIFFVLDEFFEFTDRGKQSLLYNLCDLLQSNTAQIALVGLTPRLDVENYLEKRVKSRMSCKRLIFGAPKTVGVLQRILLGALSVPTATVDAVVTAQPTAAIAPAASASAYAADDGASDALPAPVAVNADASYIERYNYSVHSALCDADVVQALSDQIDLERDTRWFMSLAAAAFSRVTAAQPELLPDYFLDALAEMTADASAAALEQCSEIELYLLVTLTHLEAKHVVPYNFALCFDEWKRYRQTHGALSVAARAAAANARVAAAAAAAADGAVGAASDWDAATAQSGTGVPAFAKAVCLKAFEQLRARELVRFVDPKVGAIALAVAGVTANAAAAANGAAPSSALAMSGDDAVDAARGASASASASGSAAAAPVVAPALPFVGFNATSNGGGGSSGVQKEFRTVRLTITPDAIHSALRARRESLPTALLEFAARYNPA